MAHSSLLLVKIHRMQTIMPISSRNQLFHILLDYFYAFTKKCTLYVVLDGFIKIHDVFKNPCKSIYLTACQWIMLFNINYIRAVFT
jgi:hypothetical protein